MISIINHIEKAQITFQIALPEYRLTHLCSFHYSILQHPHRQIPVALRGPHHLVPNRIPGTMIIEAVRLRVEVKIEGLIFS